MDDEDSEKRANDIMKHAKDETPILKWGDGKSYLEIRRIFAMLYNRNAEPFIVDDLPNPVPESKPLKWYVRVALDVILNSSLKALYEDFRLSSKLTEQRVEQIKRINTVKSNESRTSVTEFKTELDNLLDQNPEPNENLVISALLKSILFTNNIR